MKDLGTLGNNQSYGTAINDDGQVVGYSNIPGDVYAYHAFRYADGAMEDLGTLGGGYSRATGISDSGQVTGFSGTRSGETHAFLYSDGAMQDLGTLGGDFSFAYGINNRGQVVGDSNRAGRGGEHRPFLYSDGIMLDLNTLPEVMASGWTLTEARAINDEGEIVGTAISSSGIHAFRLSPARQREH
jgi:probable HAF family extracellular repeat protein